MAPGRTRTLIIIFWLLAILLGLIQTWGSRYDMNADGTSYLDIADAYLQGNWNTAINAYWSPFYSWLLAITINLIKPSAYHESTAVHILNFMIYLLALACFHFFLHGLCRYREKLSADASRGDDTILPEWALVTTGYILFIWSSLYLIGIQLVTADMCAAAFVYLISGILVRIRLGSTKWSTFFFLGLLLGFGYLTKTFMFIMGFIFIGSGLFIDKRLQKIVPRLLLSLIIFLLIATPFIIAISAAKGRPTFGDSGIITFGLGINKTKDRVQDILMHSPRKLSDTLEIYEFKTPVAGTYPLHYDPSYWNEGLKFNFNPKNQLSILEESAKTMFSEPGMIIIMCACLTFCFISSRRISFMKNISEINFLLIPALSALIMFSLVFLDLRYIAPFVTLLCMGIFSGMRLKNSKSSRTAIAIIVASLSLFLTIKIHDSKIVNICSLSHYFLTGEDKSTHRHWRIANGLRERGVQPGDEIACTGKPYRGGYWARLAKVKIVAEMPYMNNINYQDLLNTADAEVIDIFRKTGAKAIVAEIKSKEYASFIGGWQRAGDTNHYVYILEKNKN